jgi:hypothetical protein
MRYITQSVLTDMGVKPADEGDAEYLRKLGPLLAAAVNAEEAIPIDELEEFANAQRELFERDEVSELPE